jgi:hypothetical protein
MSALIEAFLDTAKTIAAEQIDFKGNRALTASTQMLLHTTINQLKAETLPFLKMCYNRFYATNAEMKITDFKIIVTWYINTSVAFDRELFAYIAARHCIDDKAKVYDPLTRQVMPASVTYGDSIRASLKDGVAIPIYKDAKGTIAICKWQTTLCIAGHTVEHITEFMRRFGAHDEKKGPQLRQVIQDKMPPMPIYADYTFDRYISHQIDAVKLAVKHFKKVNAPGYSCPKLSNEYNLLILLSGEGGTGKTSLMKVMANELQRDLFAVDLTAVKTARQFREIFTNYQKYVIALDEFDLVRKRYFTREVKSDDDRRAEIETQMNKLASQPQLSPDGQAMMKKYEQSLESLNDQLTLETFLTTIDGPREMRGLVCIMTTNCPDDIDDALKRPGRFGLRVNFKPYTSAETSEYLSMHYERKVCGEFAPTTPCILRQLCHDTLENVVQKLATGPVEIGPVNEEIEI